MKDKTMTIDFKVHYKNGIIDCNKNMTVYSFEELLTVLPSSDVYTYFWVSASNRMSGMNISYTIKEQINFQTLLKLIYQCKNDYEKNDSIKEKDNE